MGIFINFVGKLFIITFCSKSFLIFELFGCNGNVKDLKNKFQRGEDRDTFIVIIVVVVES